MTMISLTGRQLRRGDSEGEDRGQSQLVRQAGGEGRMVTSCLCPGVSPQLTPEWEGLLGSGATQRRVPHFPKPTAQLWADARELEEKLQLSSPRPAMCRASQPRPRLQGCPWRWPMVVAAAAEVGGGRGRLGGGSTGY